LVLLLPRVETGLAEAAVVIVADKFAPKGGGASGLDLFFCIIGGHGEWYLQFAVSEKCEKEKSLAASEMFKGI
jgi:hypothetical protein